MSQLLSEKKGHVKQKLAPPPQREFTVVSPTFCRNIRAVPINSQTTNNGSTSLESGSMQWSDVRFLWENMTNWWPQERWISWLGDIYKWTGGKSSRNISLAVTSVLCPASHCPCLQLKCFMSSFYPTCFRHETGCTGVRGGRKCLFIYIS